MGSLPDEHAVWFEDGYPQQVREFLNQNGGVEYLAYLNQQPRRFVSMQEDLEIGDGTLHEIHARAGGLALRRLGQQRREGKVYRVHELSKMGELVVERMQEIGVTQLHTRLRNIRDEYELSKREYLDWANDDEAGVSDRIEEFVEIVDTD